MTEGRIDDQMIEISDPNEDPGPAEPPPKVVVIEYRERGVPWMLIPPLLIIAAVASVVGYTKVSRFVGTQVVTNPVPAPKSTAPTSDREPTDPARPIDSSTKPLAAKVVEPEPVDEPAVPLVAPIAKVAELPELPVVAAQVPVEPPLAVAKPVETATFPRTTALGFDPKALEADQKGEIVPPADPAIAPAARQDPANEPAKVGTIEEKPLPTEVPLEILPPDPRQAKVRQTQRVNEVAVQVESDRVRFHNDLRELCRISRDDYVLDVKELSDRYGMQADPLVKKKAIFLLGERGRYSGVDRPTRIDVLRAVGMPETLILEDIFMNYEISRIGERSGPKNPSEAMHRAILFLLRYAPGQPASRSSSRRAASIPNPPAPGPTLLSTPGSR